MSLPPGTTTRAQTDTEALEAGLAARLALSVEQLCTVRRLLQRYLPGVEARVFGSRAAGCPKPHSDLDLLLITGLPLATRPLSLLSQDLEDSNLPFKVDLVQAHTLPAERHTEWLAASVAL
jgi:uncharacterized protein